MVHCRMSRLSSQLEPGKPKYFFFYTDSRPQLTEAGCLRSNKLCCMNAVRVHNYKFLHNQSPQDFKAFLFILHFFQIHIKMKERITTIFMA